MQYKINGKNYEIIDEIKIGHLRLMKIIQKDPTDIDSIIRLIKKLIKSKITLKEIDEISFIDIVNLINEISEKTSFNATEIKKKLST